MVEVGDEPGVLGPSRSSPGHCCRSDVVVGVGRLYAVGSLLSGVVVIGSGHGGLLSSKTVRVVWAIGRSSLDGFEVRQGVISWFMLHDGLVGARFLQCGGSM